MKNYWLLFLCLCTSIVYGQDVSAHLENWEFSTDNKVTWSKQSPEKLGQFWLRSPISINEEPEEGRLYGLAVGMLASSEVYWDGKLLGKNGSIGSIKSSEEPGLMTKLFHVPIDLLTVGEHLIEVRFSNFHAGKNIRFYGMWLVDYDNALERPLLLTAFIHIYAGFFLIIGLFYVTRYFLDRNSSTPLLFALLCLGFFALIIIEYMKFYVIYEYHWHFIRLKVILALSIFIALTLPAFFLSRFNLINKWKTLLVPFFIMLCLIFAVDYGYDFSTNLSMMLGFITSSIICIYALSIKKRDALLLLLSVLPATIALFVFFKFYDLILYIGFGNLILVNLLSLAYQERRLRNEKEAATLMSNRLKLDLLKKNIQPHFINNSITSAIDWIERSPEKGVEFLFALSREFDILLEISEKERIPLIKEIELCKAHLEIMSFRKEEPYELIVSKLDEYDIIPPAIFLTVIENGISHQKSEGRGINFHLSSMVSNGKRKYIIHVSGKSDPSKEGICAGTGTKYIEARLEESYPGAWKHTSFQVDDGWQTEISMPA